MTKDESKNKVGANLLTLIEAIDVDPDGVFHHPIFTITPLPTAQKGIRIGDKLNLNLQSGAGAIRVYSFPLKKGFTILAPILYRKIKEMLLLHQDLSKQYSLSELNEEVISMLR